MGRLASKKLPKVSLVMTVYNSDAFLAEAILSVTSQTYSNWELIILDDGSTDNSLKIAQHIATQDSRIQLYAENHQGRYPALKQACQKASGTLIALLDADDRLLPTALQETVLVLVNHPEFGGVYTDYILIDTEGRRHGLGKRCFIPYSPERLLVDFMTMHFRIKRKYFFDLVGGISTEGPLAEAAEDYDLCLRLSEVTNFYHLAKPLYEYRIHTTQISQVKRTQQIRASRFAIKRALERRGLTHKYTLHVDEENEKFYLLPRNHESI
jgi:glycosyltransferase involved in cell wall biosynthesis